MKISMKMILVPSRGFDWKPVDNLYQMTSIYRDFSPLAGI